MMDGDDLPQAHPFDEARYKAACQRWEDAVNCIFWCLTQERPELWAHQGRVMRAYLLDHEIAGIVVALMRALPEDQAMRVMDAFVSCRPPEELYPGEAKIEAARWVDDMPPLYRREMMKALWTAMSPKDRERFKRWANG